MSGSDFNVEKYVRVNSNGLLYHRSPQIIDSLVDRRCDRYFPVSGRTANPNDTVQFEISTDQFLDPLSAYLTFDLSFNTTTNTLISCATDLIYRMEIFYNDTPLERITDANAWASAFLLMSANETYLKSEGSVMGYTNQFVDNSAVNGARRYILPLSLVSGFFRCSNYIPIVGNKLKINVLLAPREQVISRTGLLTASYSLTNISLSADIVVASKSHRDKILQAINTDTLRIPFTSYQTGTYQVQPASDMYIKLSNNNTNALSVHMLYNNKSVKTLDTTNHTLYNQAFPLQNFKSLRVRSGVRTFTPSDDVNGHAELFASANKCVSAFNDISGSGVIDYQTFISGYTKASSISKTNYGFCLVSCNLEKTLSDDHEAVINNGLSANENGATNDLDVYVSMNSTAGLNSGDEWLYNIVHKRNLVFKQGAVIMEF